MLRPVKFNSTGNPRTCKPDESQWEKEPWTTFMFGIWFDSHYSYEYRVKEASGPKASFEVFAYGDLDCDGTYSTYHLTGTFNEAQGRFEGAPKMERTDPLE